MRLSILAQCPSPTITSQPSHATQMGHNWLKSFGKRVKQHRCECGVVVPNYESLARLQLRKIIGCHKPKNLCHILCRNATNSFCCVQRQVCIGCGSTT